MRFILVLVSALILGGCTIYQDFHKQPYVAYAENVPLSETSVFSAMPPIGVHLTVPPGITAVDGTRTNCFTAGCPTWVRVRPGNHIFSIRYSDDYQLAAGGVYANVAEFDVRIDAMLPRHVYAANPIRVNGRVTTDLKDLGEAPDYGITVGKDPVYYRVAF